MTNDPFDRLADAAPSVDVDAALRAVRGAAVARRRRRLAAGVLVIAVAAGAAGAGMLHDRDGNDRVVAGPVTTSTTPTLVRTATNDGLQLTVTVHGDHLVAGERTRVDVEVRNVSDGVRGIGSFGHCGGPGGLRDTSIWSEESAVPLWDARTPLAEWLQPVAWLPPRLVVPDETGCLTYLPNFQLGSGEVRTWTGVLDVEVGGTPVHEVPLQVLVVGTTEVGGGIQRSEVSLDVPLRIVDQPERLASYEDAVAAFSQSPIVADLAAGRLEGGSTGSYLGQVHLRWWEGRWELHISGMSAAGRLRVQYDPGSRSIVDARIIPSAYSAEDDPTPDVPRPADAPRDVVIPVGR